MLQELYQPNPEFAKDARVKSMYEYNALVKKATDDFLIGKQHDVEYSRITSRVTIYK